MKWLLIGVLAIGLAGCGGDQNEPTGPIPVVLRTQPPPPADGLEACMDALLEGRLVISGTSVIAVGDASGGVDQIAWPFGYSGQVDPAGLHLLDETGGVVATIGDTVQVGGGEGNGGIWVRLRRHRRGPTEVRRSRSQRRSILLSRGALLLGLVLAGCDSGRAPVAWAEQVPSPAPELVKNQPSWPAARTRSRSCRSRHAVRWWASPTGTTCRTVASRARSMSMARSGMRSASRPTRWISMVCRAPFLADRADAGGLHADQLRNVHLLASMGPKAFPSCD